MWNYLTKNADKENVYAVQDFKLARGKAAEVALGWTDFMPHRTPPQGKNGETPTDLEHYCPGLSHLALLGCQALPCSSWPFLGVPGERFPLLKEPGPMPTTCPLPFACPGSRQCS